VPDNPATLGRCVRIFGALGPVIGCAAAMTLLAIVSADSVDDVLWLPLGVIAMAIFAIPVALFVGAVPAVLVGLVYWALRAKLSLGRSAAVAWSGAAAMVVCAGVSAMPDGDFGSVWSVEAWQVAILPGLIATPLCAALVERGPRKAPDARRSYE